MFSSLTPYANNSINEPRFDSKKWNKPTFVLVFSVAVAALLVTFKFVSSCCKEFASDRC